MPKDKQQIKLRFATPQAWADLVVANVDSFMQDHAHQERKVCASALKLAGHYPHRMALVEGMIELAREELSHFKQVVDLLAERGKTLGYDRPDPYVGPLHQLVKTRDHDAFLLNRLVIFGVVEARGCERFQMVADNLLQGPIKSFYARLAQAEIRHQGVFLDLAYEYFDAPLVNERLDQYLDVEAEVVQGLELRPTLH